MKRRIAAFFALAVGIVLALAGFAVVSLGSAQTSTSRISFVLATGSTGGTYFPVGQAIAAIVSHVPDVARCDQTGVCGPLGLVASVRTSLGSIANIRDVNAGRADGALAQSDIVAEAVAGKGDFRRDGSQAHVRMIADLFPEDVHLVAARGARIARIADLAGKRVGLGPEGSGTAGTARTILAAYRLPERRLKVHNVPDEIAAEELESGKLDAFFFIGGAPVEFVESLIRSGKAVLVPIDGAGRKRLVDEKTGLTEDSIPADDYSGLREPVETVSVHAVLIVSDSAQAGLVYGMSKALFNPANRSLLDEAHPSARLIRLANATKDVPAPLHPGAARFYREMGVRLDASPPGAGN